MGWLPALQLKAANKNVLPGQPGMFFAADQVETIEKVKHTSPLMGDVHPEGNPHLHLDPYRLERVAHQLALRMGEINPEEKDQYQKNFDRFSRHWEQKIQEWENKAKSLKGMQVIAYHTSFSYFFQWLGINMIGDLEPKPGLPPTSKHLSALLEKTRNNQVEAIVYAPYQDARGARWLSNKSNIPVVQLPFTVEDDAIEADSLEKLFNSLIDDVLSIKHHYDRK